ncbi:MAG: phosphate signaling complex protein PhoU [Chloroflexi bacterium]|nr:phosphate signaling complex protein PhoU [Chloroflexota bacterium]
MPREAFNKQLAELRTDLLELGRMVEVAVGRSVEALAKRYAELAREIITSYIEINRKRFAIEEKTLRLIATQQPMASDLRILAATLSIITDLERMCDYAKGIAEINLRMGTEPLLKPLIDVPRMAQKGQEMLRRSLEAFLQRDVEEAKRVSSEDDEIDHLYNQVYRELLMFMIEDPRTITRATYLLWVAHNLERFADHVTNICERAIFAVTGKMEELNV